MQDGSGTPLAVDGVGVGVGLAGGVGVGEAAAPAPGGSVVGVGIGAGVADAVGGTAVGGTVVASITANVAAMSGVDVGKNVGCGMGTNVGCGVDVDVDANVGVGVDVRVGVGVGVGVDVACCAWSSSVIVSIVLMVARSSMPSAALPDTVSFRSGSSLLLSTAVMIQVPILGIMPVGMVNVLPDTVTNSGSSDDIDTVIVVAATEARSRVAVTALLPPFSEMEVSDSASVTTGIATPGAGGCGSACPALRMRLPLVAIWIPSVSASPSAPQQAALPAVVTAQVW